MASTAFTKVIEIEPAKVVLELSIDEAQSLLNLINHSHTLVGQHRYTEQDERLLAPLYAFLRSAGFSPTTRTGF